MLKIRLVFGVSTDEQTLKIQICEARTDFAQARPPLDKMATLLPPPKRQKVYHGIPEPVPEPQAPVPHVVVQFVSEDDGEPLAPTVNLPANISREGLEALVNKLSLKVSSMIFICGRLDSFSTRKMTQYRLRSTSHYPPTLRLLLHLHKS